METIGWSIPLNAVGVDLEDPEFCAVHTDLLPILAPFGIDVPESETYSIDIPDCVYPAGRALAASLHEQLDPALRQVGWAFGWLFSCTGNSLIDYTDEALSEIPPLSWSAEDVAFAIELIEEADGILRDVQVGIDQLNQSPDLRAALERNVAHLYREFKQKGKLNERAIRLEWTRSDDGAAQFIAGERVDDALGISVRGSRGRRQEQAPTAGRPQTAHRTGREEGDPLPIGRSHPREENAR